nr:hypothetical protein [Tanacetum cinerariifolium]
LADIQATNILSQGLPRHVFNILNQTRIGKEIWDNMELLMKGSGKSFQQKKEKLFDEYEQFRAIGNESIHGYFVRFHKLINDMKITQLDIPAHQMNTKFVNSLPLYWAKYVTNVKNNKDISATTYVELYTYLKSYEPHALKTLKKQEQSSSIVDPLAYLASITYHLTPTQPTNLPPSTSSLTLPPQLAAQPSNDAMLATMNQIVNLLSGFQKQFTLTNNQLRTSSNSRSHATVHDGHIVTKTVQRKASGNVGNTGTRGTQSYGQVTDNKGKLVICYNCREEGYVSRQCKVKKRVKDSQYFKDKMLLMEAKEKGVVLDAEAEAFLADVECTAPYDQPLAITTINIFEVSHEDAYDFDVDKGPHAASAFMANLSSTSRINCATTSHVNEVHTNDNQIFDNVNHLLAHVMHQEEHQDSDVESDIDDNTISYHQYQLDSEVQDVPTKVSFVSPGEISMITILDDLRNQLDRHLKVNQEQSMVNDSLRAELARFKLELQTLERNKAKIAQPTFYDGHALLKPTNTSVRVHDSEESLVQSHFVPQNELSREQVYWLPAEELATQKSNPPKPVTPFVHTRSAPSKVRTQLLKIKDCFPAFETIIKRKTTPTFHEQGECRFVHTKKAFTEQVIPFDEHVKELVQRLDENIVKEVTEFMRIFDELDKEYEQCVLEKNKLQIEKKNLLIQNECLITDCIAKDICSIVLASDRDMPPSEEPSSNYKKHIDLQIKFRSYKECLKNQTIGNNSHSPTVNAVFKINQLKEQLQGKDDTIRKLHTQINSMSMLNVEPTVGSFDKQALETELTQLKDAITSVRIQNDGFKVENVNLKRRYQELSTSNSHSCDTLTRKITALTIENAKLKSEMLSKMHSKPIVPEKPKVLAPRMYAIRVKPATRASKPMSKSATRNHSTLLAKREKARRVEDHHRNLNKQNHIDSRLNVKRTGFVSKSNTVCNACNKSLFFANHDNCVVRNLKSVNVKTLTAKHNVKTTKKVWKAKVVTVRSQWKPIGRRFTLYDKYPLTKIVEPIVEPLELTPCVSSNSKVTMISRFADYKLSNRKAGSKGIYGIFEC